MRQLMPIPIHPYWKFELTAGYATGRLKTLSCSALALLFIVFANSARATVSMTWLTVGNPGNPNDTADGDVFEPGVQNFGMVATIYRIAAHEVTNAQYAEFLNVVDATGVNPNGIYNSSMGSDVRGGISFTGANPVGSKYAAKTNMENKPVNYVSWFDSARFANWLHNGQIAGGTENGAYDMTIGTPVRLAGATVFLPSGNEWYKAAFYDPVNAGADAGGNLDYWLYPTMSDLAPTVGSASAIGDISNPGPNVANYNLGADWNALDGNVTTVGSATSTSHSGAFDMVGNVWEWNETIHGPSSPPSRGLRGGSWVSNAGILSSVRLNHLPTNEDSFAGFRVASIPEPATCSLMLIALVGLGYRRRRG